MYEYFNGKITSVTPYYIVVECSGVGYKLNVANPFKYQIGQETKIYVYQAVRENEISLFGFYDLSEKQLFLKLISVSGIGPKSALAILAANDQGGFVAAINNDDDKYLTKFPSIGKKTAKQLILDLKGKLDEIEVPLPLFEQQDLNLDQVSPYLKESIEALSALGYTKTEIKKITKKLSEFRGDSTDAYLREGLRLLMNK